MGEFSFFNRQSSIANHQSPIINRQMVRPRTRCRLLFLVPHDYCMILLGAKLAQGLCEPAALLEKHPSPGLLKWITELDPKEIVVLGAECSKPLRQALRELAIPIHSIPGATPQQISLKAYREYGAKSGLRPLLTWDQDPIDWPDSLPLFFSGDWDALGALRDLRKLLVAQTPFGPLRGPIRTGALVPVADYRYHTIFTPDPFELRSNWSGTLLSDSGPIPFQRQVQYRCNLPIPPREGTSTGAGLVRSAAQSSLAWWLSEFADRDGDGRFEQIHDAQYFDMNFDGEVDRRVSVHVSPSEISGPDHQYRQVEESWDPHTHRWRARAVTTEYSSEPMACHRRVVEEDADGDGVMERRTVTDVQKQGPLTVGEEELKEKKTGRA